MRVVQLFTFSIVLLLSGALNAAETKFILQFGIEGGGDELVTTTDTDITAGGGWNIGGGFSLEPENSSIAYVGTIGYMFDSVDFDIPSGSTAFNTIPLEFTVRKKFGSHQIGGGLTFHMNPEWELCIDGVGCETAEFDSALGFNILYSYNFQKMFITGKFTFIEYDIASISVDADSFGLYLGFKF